MSNYIYLLHEREFVNNNEYVYKIGKTIQSNLARFQQYPKGSVLLIQITCTNCHEKEKELIKIFKEKYKLRKDIGSEYFEGCYLSMIDTIYHTVKVNVESNEVSNEVNNEENVSNVSNVSNEVINVSNVINIGSNEVSNEVSNEKVTTYREYLVCSSVKDIIITNLEDFSSYVKFDDLIYKRITSEEKLRRVLTCSVINTEHLFDFDNIIKDIKSNNIVLDNSLEYIHYHEYVYRTFFDNCNVVFNALDLTFTLIMDLPTKKIITSDDIIPKRIILNKDINVEIVDTVLDLVIDNRTELKRFMWNILAYAADCLVFKTNNYIVREWIIYLLRKCYNTDEYYAYSSDYIQNPLKYKKIKLIITEEENITYFQKLKIPNILVYIEKKDLGNSRLIKFINENKIVIYHVLKSQSYDLDNFDAKYENLYTKMINYPYEIFNNDEIFYSNFLIWCCK